MNRTLNSVPLILLVSGCMSSIPQEPYSGFLEPPEISTAVTLVGVIDKEIPLVRFESYVGFCGANSKSLSGDLPNVIYIPPGRNAICVTYITPKISHPDYRMEITVDLQPAQTYTVSAKGVFMGYDYFVHDNSGKQVYPK